MSYNTILVHVDLSPHAAARIRLAATLARSFGAHLVGAAMTGISRFAYPGTIDLARTVIAGYADTLYQHADQALARFEELARAASVESFEPRLIADEPESGLILLSRFADLLVLSQTDPDYAPPDTVRDLPAGVVLDASCPVLLAPLAGNADDTAGTALIGWNGSRESSHAVAGAMPLLQRAANVIVAQFADGSASLDDAQASELLAWLARHGVRARLEQRHAGPDTGADLLEFADAQHAGLIVVGAYGRTRLREFLLGGVTRSVLHAATVPVLMSH